MSYSEKIQAGLISGVLNTALPGGPNGILSILTFHKVPKTRDLLVPDELDMAEFETIIDFLKQHTRVLSLGEAVEKLRLGTLPARAVALTFDDGYVEWSRNVADALLKRSLPATFFVSTEILDGIPNWHERIVEAVRVLPSEGLKLPAGTSSYTNLTSNENRIALIRELQSRLKYVHLDERLEAIASLEAQAVDKPNAIPKFTSADIRSLHSRGFDIGGHTRRHPILTKCTDKEAVDEIAGCKSDLESIVGGKVSYFAYPNGRPNLDFFEKHAVMAKAVGYSAAFSTSTGVATQRSDSYQLPRAAPWPSTPIRMAIQLARNRTGKTSGTNY
jgi:peptidoglycan/xylan/chitin deacetylase (PgdA/CDA1 family)